MNAPLFARHWAREFGATEESLIQLEGGINNAVYLCGDGQNKKVIKSYRPAEFGKPDRMKAEVDFLTYSAKVAPAFVPKLITIDTERRCVVLEYLTGDLYQEGQMLDTSDIRAAIHFFSQLNADRKMAHYHLELSAAEGYMRLTDHITNISKRLKTLQTEHLPIKTLIGARSLLQRLTESTNQLANHIENLIARGAIVDTLHNDFRCVSPSDFGFHNAIKTATGVKFIDFEFAGWDDPTKVAADFMLQPKVPVHPTFTPMLREIGYRNTDQLLKRYSIMYRILSHKWVCIILRVLNPAHEVYDNNFKQPTKIKQIINDRLSFAEMYINKRNIFHLI